MRIIFGVDNFNNHHRDYFSNGSDLLNMYDIPRDLQLQAILTPLVVILLLAINCKLIFNIVSMVNELNNGCSLNLKKDAPITGWGHLLF